MAHQIHHSLPYAGGRNGHGSELSVVKILAALFFFLVMNAQAESFEAKVLAVMDGDTVFVKSGAFKAKIRLLNIDAPEKEQPYGKQSQESLQSLIGGKVIHVESKAVDKFGRTIALISIGDINVNEEQVRRGMAWANSRSRESRTYAKLQSEAQQARRGLWSQPAPQQPSQWRRGHVTGEASRLRGAPPAAHLQQDENKTGISGRRKPHPPEPARHTNRPQHKALPHTQKPDRFGNLACGKKNYCSQMVTCDEAHFYLTVCGVKRLDTNKDGIPCESLCGVLE